MRSTNQHISRQLCAIELLTTMFCITASTQTVYAKDQDQQANTQHLDQIVVTGTRSERKLIDVPVRTEVITRDQLELTHARDIAEALEQQPGLLLRDIHGKGGTEIWMQGLDSDRVLVLIDGKPVSASTGSTIDITQITTSNVERIEIVKGAVSALYGSAAMGGVINVITRSPNSGSLAELVVDTGTYGEHNVEKIAFGEQHVATNGQLTKGRISAGLNLDVQASDGFDLDDSTFEFEGHQGTAVNLTGSLSFDITPNNTLQFRSSWYNEDVERDFSTFAPGIGDIDKLDIEEATRYTQTLDWKAQLSNDSTFSVWALLEHYDDTSIQDTVATDFIDQRRQADIITSRLDLQYDRPINDYHTLTVGAVIGNTELEQTVERVDDGSVSILDELTPGSNASNLDAFFQSDVFIGERWELLPGFRIQEDSDFGTHVAPKINVLFQPRWWPGWRPRIRAGAGSGYRVPNLKERHFLFDHSALGYIVLGNPELQPEESLSFQLGLELSRANGTRAEISLFHNRFTDLITTSLDSQASTENNLQVFRYDNIDNATTRGLEFSLALPLHANLEISSAWAFLNARNSTTGLVLTRRPEHQIQLGANYKHGKTTITLQSTWQSKEFVDSENLFESPSFTSVALKVNRTITSSLRIFAGIDNITDETRNPENPGIDVRPTEPRFAYLGARYKFQ